jgi:CRISPR-associated protein Cmr6
MRKIMKRIKMDSTGLLIGSGMEHEINTEAELKLGFYFDFTSGMPVIPGSSVKGALRSVFPQWGKHKDTSDEIKWTKTFFIKSILTGVDIETLKTSNRGREYKKEIVEIEEEIFDGKMQGKPISIYNRDVFFDAIITKPSNYASTKDQILGTDSITPHVHEGLSYAESMMKNPVPLPFLKVLPGVEFIFQFDLKERKNQSLTIKQRIDLFKAIILTTGLGAKTNVGYGQFRTP